MRDGRPAAAGSAMGKGRLGWVGRPPTSPGEPGGPFDGLGALNWSKRLGVKTIREQCADDGRVAETNCSRQGRRFDALRLL
jgi:hypothetical protein